MGNRKNEATRDKLVLKKPSRDPSYRRVQGNYPAMKYKKGTPVITRLSFECTGTGTNYIDLAAALSAINRKQFRQGLYYYVNKIELYDSATTFVDIHTLPDTWVTRAAHRRGKGIFDEMNEFAVRNSGNLYPKYHDFKVYMNAQHAGQGTLMPALYGINQEENLISPDEWTYSQYVSADSDGDATLDPNTGVVTIDQNADNFTAHMVGPHQGTSDNWSSIGLIKSYAESRVRQNLENPVIDAGLLADPLVNLMDFSTEEQINELVTNLDEDNDAPPYDLSVYVGENERHLHHVARLTTTAESGRVTSAPGFCAPLGLIAIDPPTPGAGPENNYRIVIELAVGTYNGVYCERM